MKILCLGATKGGVGKSTLAAALAVEASRRNYRVAVLDLDAQQSLARWHGRPSAVPRPSTCLSLPGTRLRSGYRGQAQA